MEDWVNVSNGLTDVFGRVDGMEDISSLKELFGLVEKDFKEKRDGDIPGQCMNWN